MRVPVLAQARNDRAFDRGAPRKEFKPGGGFKKKFVGKAAGAKGAFKPGSFKKKFKSKASD